MAEIYKAKLGDYELRLLTISDSYEHSLVKHEFIDLDGARVDNLGRHARVISFRAFFYGDSTIPDSASYRNHFDALEDYLNSGVQTTLVHPVYGAITCRIQSLNIVSDDTQNYIAIDFTIVEDFVFTSIPSEVQSLNSILQGQQIEAMNDTLANFSNVFVMGDAAGATGVMPDQKLVDQFRNVSRATRTFLNQMDSAIGIFNSFLSQVTEPLNTIDTAINFINDVPSMTIGSINSAVNRIVGTLSHLYTLPAQFANNFVTQLDILSKQLSPLNPNVRQAMQQQLYVVGAGQLSVQTAGMLVQDNSASAAKQRQESQPSFDDAGNRIVTGPTVDTMTTNDLELLLYIVRSLIQQVIDWPFTDPEAKANARNNPQLLNMASALRTFVDEVKVGRLSVKVISTNNIPLMLLVTSMGLSYNATERVLKLNPSIKCPTFVSGILNTYVK